MVLNSILLAAVLTATGFGDAPSFVQFGANLSRGGLVNLTPGTRPCDPPDPRRPTVVFIHGFNPAPRLVHFTMAEQLAGALARRGCCAFNVLAWDWNGATFTSLHPNVNAARTIEQGARLGSALLASGIDPSQVQLIGHSSGGILAASAARTLAAMTGRRVAQLTLLDPAVMYHDVIFEQLAAGAWAVRVENYWAPSESGYGKPTPFANVWNVMVPGPTPHLGAINPLRSNHLHVVQWYIATVLDPYCPSGFNRSLLLPAPCG